jgi:folate-dependent phosphoribosylglycinamide formyltransferase PurN
VIFISGGGSFAAHAKQSPVLSEVTITIVADRHNVRKPETVGQYLIKKETPDYWDKFLALAARFDLVFLNFDWIVPAGICQKLRGKMINQHPALLPSFKGIRVENMILQSGVRLSGSTFHFVLPEVDSGPIIAQTFFPVSPDDTTETIGTKNWQVSKDAYVQVIRWFADGRVFWDGGQTVRISGAQYNFSECIPNIEFKRGDRCVSRSHNRPSCLG